jgi:hypothetical protein
VYKVNARPVITSRNAVNCNLLVFIISLLLRLDSGFEIIVEAHLARRSALAEFGLAAWLLFEAACDRFHLLIAGSSGGNLNVRKINLGDVENQVGFQLCVRDRRIDFGCKGRVNGTLMTRTGAETLHFFGPGQ